MNSLFRTPLRLFRTLLALLLIHVSAHAQRNVILIIADDLSPDYLGFYAQSSDTAITPSLRALAERGIVFSNFWSTPLCSPTRSEIFTGRYPFRTGIGSVVAGPMSTQLDTSEISVARLLKYNAPTRYATANLGKWHLHLPNPSARRLYPNIMGYDLYSGNFSGMLPDFYLYARIRNGLLDTVRTYATTQTVNEAIEWIASVSKSQPFFCWLAFNAPHTPFHVPPSNLCDTKGLVNDTNAIRRNPVPYFKAAVQAMDTEIGRLLTALKQSGRLDSTDVIFIGDNGNAPQVAQNADPKKSKATCYDYGIHVPLVIAGPSVVQPGRFNSSLINAPDLFATILDLCRFPSWRNFIPPSTVVDAVSIAPIIRHEQDSVRSWVYSEQFTKPPIDADAKTIRNGRYQLLVPDSGAAEFYDLIADPSENTNLLLGVMTAEQQSNYLTLCTQLNALRGTNLCSVVEVHLEEQTPSLTIMPNPAATVIQLHHADLARRIRLISGEGAVREIGNEQAISLREIADGQYFLWVEWSSGSCTTIPFIIAH